MRRSKPFYDQTERESLWRRPAAIAGEAETAPLPPVDAAIDDHAMANSRAEGRVASLNHAFASRNFDDRWGMPTVWRMEVAGDGIGGVATTAPRRKPSRQSKPGIPRRRCRPPPTPYHGEADRPMREGDADHMNLKSATGG